jgi:hypothetical protein
VAVRAAVRQLLALLIRTNPRAHRPGSDGTKLQNSFVSTLSEAEAALTEALERVRTGMWADPAARLSANTARAG